jgi:hypothetical protein
MTSMNEIHMRMLHMQKRIAAPPARPAEVTVVVLGGEAAYIYTEGDVNAMAKADEGDRAGVPVRLRTYLTSDLPRVIDELRVGGIETIHDLRKDLGL